MDTQPLPTSKKEVDALGWDYIDIILFTGDAYIDHPSFGTAVIGRVLQNAGYRVAVVPQPNWRDDLRDFKKLGEPRLYFGVNSGAMDSMVNHYTANKRLRSNDAYTPDGAPNRRPDYAVSVYSSILKKIYPHIPIVIGGIESSLRRLTHYDYWSDTLMPSILISSTADILVYGMGERAALEIADRLNNGATIEEIQSVPQIAYLSRYRDIGVKGAILLHSFEECLRDKRSFIENFNTIERESNKLHAAHITEPYRDLFVHINSPFSNMTTAEIDSYYDLPYTKKPHPRYQGKHIPAYEMIKFSINTHRGCFGACAFCTISAHQGKFIVSRSESSIVKEIERMVNMPDFKGVISDVGAPTANMYNLQGRDLKLCNSCSKDSCIYPKICKNLNLSHNPILDLFSKIEKIKGIKRFFVGSGIRYDLFLDENGYLDISGEKYFEEIILKHTSGRLKVAPEHTEDVVLKAMGKPSFRSFRFLKSEFHRINRTHALKYQIVPYFISSHPGCGISEMRKLSENPDLKGVLLEQVQDFTPTPMTRSSVSFYTGIDPKSGKNIFVERNLKNKLKQKSFFKNL